MHTSYEVSTSPLTLSAKSARFLWLVALLSMMEYIHCLLAGLRSLHDNIRYLYGGRGIRRFKPTVNCGRPIGELYTRINRRFVIDVSIRHPGLLHVTLVLTDSICDLQQYPSAVVYYY